MSGFTLISTVLWVWFLGMVVAQRGKRICTRIFVCTVLYTCMQESVVAVSNLYLVPLYISESFILYSILYLGKTWSVHRFWGSGLFEE